MLELFAMKARWIFSLFTIFFFTIIPNCEIHGQKREFKWIKPTEVKSKNYKLANKLYRSGGYEAGYFTIDYKKAKKFFRGHNSAIAVETIRTSELLQVPLWQSDTYKSKLDVNRLSGDITSARKRKQLFKEAKSNAFCWFHMGMKPFASQGIIFIMPI